MRARAERGGTDSRRARRGACRRSCRRRRRVGRALAFTSHARTRLPSQIAQLRLQLGLAPSERAARTPGAAASQSGSGGAEGADLEDDDAHLIRPGVADVFRHITKADGVFGRTPSSEDSGPTDSPY